MTNKEFRKILGMIVVLLLAMVYAVKYEVIISLIGLSIYCIIGITLLVIISVMLLPSEEEDC